MHVVLQSYIMARALTEGWPHFKVLAAVWGGVGAMEHTVTMYMEVFLLFHMVNVTDFDKRLSLPTTQDFCAYLIVLVFVHAQSSCYFTFCKMCMFWLIPRHNQGRINPCRGLEKKKMSGPLLRLFTLITSICFPQPHKPTSNLKINLLQVGSVSLKFVLIWIKTILFRTMHHVDNILIEILFRVLSKKQLPPYTIQWSFLKTICNCKLPKSSPHVVNLGPLGSG